MAREKRRGWRDELALIETQPATGAGDTGSELAIGAEDLVPHEEPAAIGRVTGEKIGDGDFLLQPDFPEVLQFVFHDDRPHTKAHEFLHGKSVLDQEHLADVGGFVEVGRVLHVGVEVHVGPAGVELFRVHDRVRCLRRRVRAQRMLIHSARDRRFTRNGTATAAGVCGGKRGFSPPRPGRSP